MPAVARRGEAGLTRVMSPDRLTTAELLEAPTRADAEFARQSLWIVDNRTKQRRKLLASRFAPDFDKNLTNLSRPLFSLDGGYIYITSSDAPPTSAFVHQVRIATGAVRTIVNGDALAVIRTGPYRGYLLVQRHRYYDRTDGGSYNPVYVVRPDGHEMFAVPGSQNDDGEYAVAPWLRAKGWVAN